MKKIDIETDWDISILDPKNPTTLIRPDIISVEKEVMYGETLTPMLTVIFRSTPIDVNIIKKSEGSLLVKIKKTDFRRIKGNPIILNGESPMESTISFDTMFVPLFESEDLSDISKAKNSDELINDPYSDNPAKDMRYTEVRMYLHTLAYHKFHKTMYNCVYRGPKDARVYVGDVLTALIEDAPCTGCVVDGVSNIIPYKNIVIPPGDLRYAIDALQITYGIYDRGLLLYFDFDGKLYILNRFSNKHRHEANKTKRVVMKIATTMGESEAAGNHLIEYLDDNTMLYTMSQNIEIESEEISSGEAEGDVLTYTNYGFGKKAFYDGDNGKLGVDTPISRQYVRESLSHLHTGQKTAVDYDELNNPFNLQSYMAELGITTTFTLDCKGMDEDAMLPNVVYSVVLDSTNKDMVNRFRDGNYPIMGFNKLWTRKTTDKIEDSHFISTDTIILAEVDDRNLR